MIEVVAGVVVLATVVAAVAIARGRFLRQWGDAERKLTAAREVDAMMTRWMDAPGALVVPSHGALEKTRGCEWAVQYVADPQAQTLGARVVRLEVVDRRVTNAKPVLSIDFLVHYAPRLATRPTTGPVR